uniref:HTH_48 domain-containing protein n=1 Tax=Strongyloides venezuelensis TaxID=75913 RepID=A0A0K0F0H8_STRVS
MLSKRDIRATLLYEFKRGTNVKKTNQKINESFRENFADFSTVKRWLKKFKKVMTTSRIRDVGDLDLFLITISYGKMLKPIHRIRLYASKMVLQILGELEYKTLFHPAHPLYLASTDYYLFKHLNNFLTKEIFISDKA